MKTVLGIALLLVSTSVVAQDPAAADPAHTKVVFENDQLRVLLVTLPAGEKSPVVDHVPSMAIALTDRKEHQSLSADSKGRDVSARAGDLVLLSAGKFRSENMGEKTSSTLIVEYKTPDARSAMTAALSTFVKPPPPIPPASQNNEISAIATMRTLNTAEAVFLNTYNKGYTDGLNRMGEPSPPGSSASESRADLLAPFLAGLADGGNNTTAIHNGYRFTYTPGPGGYGAIRSYTVVAQPLQYGVSGTKSFFTDQDAVVHVTTENRKAGKDDPTI